jgi:3-mercaptopyruvate sulfurtransferase SseA
MGLIPEVMISPKTLNNWLTMGYGTDTFRYNRMVILTVDSQESYKKGHVPGAYLLEDNNVDLWATRSNGITDSPFQVATKAQMDKIIRRTNIDNDSIVVITGNNMVQIGRVYFNFRYWGFPRQSLKVLNSTNATYAAAGFPLQTIAPPAPVPCQYSVCSLQQQYSVYKVRASFQEMLLVAEDNNPETVIIDSRSPEEYAGKAGSTPLNPEGTEYVVFEGHIQTAVNQDYKTLQEGQSNTNPLLSKAELAAAFKQIDVDKTSISFVYSRTGPEAALTFLALDAVLNWPAKIYDGGWNQWGQMAEISPTKGGLLEKGSPWRTDTPGRSESITYNKPNGFIVITRGYYQTLAKHADEVNRQDSAICGGTAEGIDVAPLTPGY